MAHVNGKLLKMVTQIDGSFGPVAATAAAAAAAATVAPRRPAAAVATPPPRHGGGSKRISLFFILERFEPFWTVLSRHGPFLNLFGPFLNRFDAVVDRFRTEIWCHRSLAIIY